MGSMVQASDRKQGQWAHVAMDLATGTHTHQWGLMTDDSLAACRGIAEGLALSVHIDRAQM